MLNIACQSSCKAFSTYGYLHDSIVMIEDKNAGIDKSVSAWQLYGGIMEGKGYSHGRDT